MSNMTAIAIINTAIVLTVGAISIGGMVFFHSFGGLWSILMMIFMVSSSNEKGSKE